MISILIKNFFENFSLAMLLFSIILAAIQSHFFTKPSAEYLFRWTAVFALGITGIYTFILHAFFPVVSAASIGWATSPFQYEVAMANLAIGSLGIFSFKASKGFRLATLLAAIIWLWGDASGHIYQMIIANNFTIGNAGSWFWTDILTPLLLLIAFTKINRKIY